MSATAFQRRRREMQQEADEKPATQRPVFDLSGYWMQTRARVRHELKTHRVPASKAEAAEWLREAGYEVEGE